MHVCMHVLFLSIKMSIYQFISMSQIGLIRPIMFFLCIFVKNKMIFADTATLCSDTMVYEDAKPKSQERYLPIVMKKRRMQLTKGQH